MFLLNIFANLKIKYFFFNMMTRWFNELATPVKRRRSFKKNLIMYVDSSNVWHVWYGTQLHATIFTCRSVTISLDVLVTSVALVWWIGILSMRWIWDEKVEPCSQWRRNLREEVFTRWSSCATDFYGKTPQLYKEIAEAAVLHNVKPHNFFVILIKENIAKVVNRRSW